MCDQKFTNVAKDGAISHADRMYSIGLSLWDNVLHFWLAKMGYQQVYMCPDSEEYIKFLQENPETVYMAGGPANRGFDHMVLYKNNQLLWDVHPSGDGLIKATEFYRLDKLIIESV
jgi:hypothetical protein